MNVFFRSLIALFLVSSLQAEDPGKSEKALASLKFPGVKINLEKRSVDVTSSVCLEEGSLEFIACTKDTKEHESMVRVHALPSHIHLALLLLGAKAGHPAIQKVIGEGDNQRWIDFPPKGSPVSVSLVITGKDGRQKEHPISDFVAKIQYDSEEAGAQSGAAGENKEGLDTFLFAGSHLNGKDDGPQVYLADRSGSVISLSTFGDELLCLPEVHANQNHALQWALNSEHLPKVGTEVILRLKPQQKKEIPKK